MKDARDFAKATDSTLLELGGALRRMAITLTAKALWQLAGFRLPGSKQETHMAEPFLGIGVHARPPSSGKPEAIVVMVGGSTNPMVIAVRDEKTRAAIAGALLEDETMLFNSKAFVYVKADGTIEARSAAGVAVPLAKASELTAVANDFYAHVHVASGGPTGAPIPNYNPITDPVPSAMSQPATPGTTKLKGE